MNMNAVGIDVSNGKSTVAILRPYGESRIVMEHTAVITKPLSVNAHRLTFL